MLAQAIVVGKQAAITATARSPAGDRGSMRPSQLEAARGLDPRLPEGAREPQQRVAGRGDHDAARQASSGRSARPTSQGAQRAGRRRLAQATTGVRGCFGARRSIRPRALYNLCRAQALAAATPGEEAATPHAGIVHPRGTAAVRRPRRLLDSSSPLSRFDLRHPVGRARGDCYCSARPPAVDAARLMRPIVSLVVTQRRGSRSAVARWRNGIQPAQAGPLRTVLGDPLLQRLLEDVVVASTPIQRLVAVARRELLREWSAAPAVEPSLPLPAIGALALQGFNTEYVNAEDAGETAALADLAGAIAAARAAGRAVPPHWYAILGCYRPLLALPDEIAAVLASASLPTLAARQIGEPREELRLRSTIPTLTAIVDAVSAAVRDQYEANPYPRWRRTRCDPTPTTPCRHLRRMFPEADLAIWPMAGRILVAGCGTGCIRSARRCASASAVL
jgi:hypothetical protein